MTRSVPAEWRDPTSTTSPTPLGDELGSAEDERPHEDLAELAVALHEAHELPPLHLDDVGIVGGDDPHQATTAGEHAHLAGELPHPGAGDHQVTGRRGADDLEAPGDDDEERGVPAIRVDDHFATRDASHTPVRGDARQLIGGQGGKDVLHRGARSDGAHRPV